MPLRERGPITAVLILATAVLCLAPFRADRASPPAQPGPTCQDDRGGWVARAVATEGTIVPRLTTSPDRPLPGQEFWLSVVLEMSGCDRPLASYGARLRWDPKQLEMLEVTGGATGGFTAPVINRAGAAAGEIRFAHANPQGASVSVEILRVRFLARRAVAKPDRTFRIEFTSMGGVGPRFEDLKPLLRVEGRESAKEGG